MARNRILFLSHEARLYGATRSLLQIMRYVRQAKDWELRTLVREVAGPLSPSLQRAAQTRYFDIDSVALRAAPRARRGWKKKWRHRRAQALTWIRRRRTLRWVRAWKPDVIYSNTSLNGDVIERLGLPAVPVIVHVRELQWYLGRLNPEQLQSLRTRPSLYLAVSDAVRRNLIQQHGIPAVRIQVVPPSVDEREVLELGRARPREVVRRDLGLGPGDLLIGAIGYAELRKGTDLFIQTAARVLESARGGAGRVFFAWVGDGPELENLRRAAALTAWPERFLFPGLQENPYPFIQSLDTLFMCSRDDPFPRVNLEAGLLGVPVVTFAESGGSAEFVGRDCGFVVAGFDCEAAAGRLRELIGDPPLRKRLGEAAAAKVRSGYVTAVVGARVAALIEQVLAPQARPGAGPEGPA